MKKKNKQECREVIKSEFNKKKQKNITYLKFK